MLIVVDDNDNFIRYEPKSKCHTGDGIRHRAIMLLLFNKDGKILLQKRKHRLFDDMWDMAGATHPLHLGDRDESYEESGQRCLKDEWGISTSIENVFAFTYFERYNGKCENEYCMLLIGQYDGELHPSEEVSYGYRWISWDQILKEIEKKPENFTPWALAAVERMKTHPSLERLRKI